MDAGRPVLEKQAVEAWMTPRAPDLNSTIATATSSTSIPSWASKPPEADTDFTSPNKMKHEIDRMDGLVHQGTPAIQVPRFRATLRCRSIPGSATT